MKNTIKVNIPFFGQKNSLSNKTKDWERKICGLACIKMCLEYFNGNSPNLEELLKYKNGKYKFLNINSGNGKEYSYYIKGTGWLHYGLLSIVKKYGLFGVVEKIDIGNIEIVLEKYISQNVCVIASVNLNFDNKDLKGGHLVVIKGFEENEKGKFIILNDPINTDGEIYIEIEKFKLNFSGNLILVSNQNKEWFSSNSPIYINSYKKRLSQNSDKLTFFHIHENEELAIKETIKFIKKNGNGRVLFLKQNGERFLRYEIKSDNNEKIFLRIDPNRIFDDKELEKTIVERNNHLDLKNLDKVIFIGKNIRDYIIKNLALRKDRNYVCIHTNKLLNIDNYKADYVHINDTLPKNSFIITSNLSDFKLLKKKNINAVYYKNEDDGSLRDYLQKNGYRSFTIESGYNDKKAFRFLLEQLKEIIN